MIKACLEKDPQERLQTAHDVRLQLKWIAENGEPRVPARTRRTVRLGWMVAALAALIAIALVSAYVMFRSNPALVVRASILPPPGTAFLTASIWASSPALSPDGTRMAFAARDEGGKIRLYVRPLNSLEAQALAGTENAHSPFWSPDGREIGFFANGKLKKIDTGGGPPQTLCDASGFGGAWSKDGIIVFEASAYDALSRVPASGGAPEPASKLDASQAENSHRWPYFLPDGKNFLFWSRSSRGVEANALYVGTLGSLQPRLLMKSESMAAYASGYLLFMRGQALTARPFDLGRLEFTGEGVRVADRVAVSGATNRAMFSVSDNGALLYKTGDAVGEWSIQWIDRDGKQAGSVAQPDHYLWPSLSPDGKRLAVVILNGAQGTGDIWILDLVQGTKTRLTFGTSFERFPVWSSEGKTIFYAASQSGTSDIYGKASDGSGSERLVLHTDGASDYPTSVSPDGRCLVYMNLSDNQSIAGVWALPLIGGGKPFRIVQPTLGGVAPASVSPDGRWLAYQSEESGRTELYVTAFPGAGAKWQVSTNGGQVGKWRRDGKELFFLDLTGNIMAVNVSGSDDALRFGTPHPLFHIEANFNGPYDVTADGKKFLVNAWDKKEGGEPATLVINWPAELRK